MKFKYLLIMSVALLVAGCDKTPVIETVESLVANPERLRELRAQCKADHAKAAALITEWSGGTIEASHDHSEGLY